MKTGRPRQPTNDPQPVAPGKPTAPKGLPESWLWDEVCEHLPPDVLSLLDRPALEGLCVWYAEWKTIQQKEVKTDRDLRSMSMIWKDFLNLARAFGMTPADRGRLKGAELPTESPKILSIIEEANAG